MQETEKPDELFYVPTKSVLFASQSKRQSVSMWPREEGLLENEIIAAAHTLLVSENAQLKIWHVDCAGV